MKDLFGNIDEEGMYQMAINRPLDEKIEQAIFLIQSMEGQALKLCDDGFYVCDSFGKDSTVMRRLFQMASVRFQCHHNNTTIDPPELLQFGKKHHPDAIWHSVGVPLPLYMAQKTGRRLGWLGGVVRFTRNRAEAVNSKQSE